MLKYNLYGMQIEAVQHKYGLDIVLITFSFLFIYELGLFIICLCNIRRVSRVIQAFLSVG